MNVLVLGGTIAPGDVPALCARIHRMLASRSEEQVFCDVGGLKESDAATIDALARLQLSVKRLGSQVRLIHAPSELQDLLALTGLSEVVPCELGVEPVGETEEREEVLGVQEEADPGDLSARDVEDL